MDHCPGCGGCCHTTTAEHKANTDAVPTGEQHSAEQVAHAFAPETTNGGACFSDCSCGWSGGVWSSRSLARIAWMDHRDGREIRDGAIKPTLLLGPRAQGMQSPIRDGKAS